MVDMREVVGVVGKEEEEVVEGVEGVVVVVVEGGVNAKLRKRRVEIRMWDRGK